MTAENPTTRTTGPAARGLSRTLGQVPQSRCSLDDAPGCHSPASHAPGSNGPGDADGHGPSRRNVLAGGAAALALGAAHVLGDPTSDDSAVTRYAFAPTASAAAVRRDTLVVLSFRGGFDGLSAVVPAAEQRLATLRPTVAAPTSKLLQLDARFGLHPALAPLLPLYEAGTLGFVHDVGQASATRSHFAAMAEMERAAPTTSLRTGWLDRAVGIRPGGTALQATQVGSLTASQGLAGPHPEYSLGSVDGFRLSGTANANDRAPWAGALRTMHTEAHPSLRASVGNALSAMETVFGLAARPGGDPTVSPYPRLPNGTLTPLAEALRDTARLIKADVGLEVACVDHGDWDMHVAMGTSDRGWMTDKLGEVARALAAFAEDLGPRLQDTTLVTMSEFGRRVKQNGSGGTDHGHGNLVMMLGGGTVGGKVHGHWPGLADSALADGDLPGSTDYRTILAEVLEKRCATTSVARDVFPGLPSTRLGLVRQKA